MASYGPQFETHFVNGTAPKAVNVFPNGPKKMLPGKKTGSKKLPLVKLFFAVLALAILTVGSKQLFSPAQLKSAVNLNASPEPLVLGDQSSQSQIPPVASPAAAPPPAAVQAPAQKAAATPAPSKKFIQITSTPTGYLNVRTGPSLSGSIIGKAYPGKTYAYTAAKDGWYDIILNSNQSGWVNGAYTTARNDDNE